MVDVVREVETVTQARVWVVSELYYPEETSTGYFLTGIAEGLASEFPTGVICCQPTYSSRGVKVPWRQSRHGVEIVRCRSSRLDPHFLPSRLVNMLTMSVSMLIAALRNFRRGDVVIVVTNPPTIPLVVSLAARVRGATAVLLVHDVYPDVLAAVGMLSKSSWAFRFLDWMARRACRRFQRIVVLGRDMKRLFAEKLGSDERLRVIPNWGDVENVHPLVAANPMRQKLGLADKFVVQYGGNMGRTHGLDEIVMAAHALRDHPRVHFMLMGWGSRLRWVEDEVMARGLTNVTIHPPVAREELCLTLNVADVALVSLLKGMSGVSVPSRMYNILAAGRPLIAMADSDSELATVVAENECGWIVAPGDVEGLIETIGAASQRPEALTRMSRNARLAAEQKYSREGAMSSWRDLMRAILDPMD